MLRSDCEDCSVPRLFAGADPGVMRGSIYSNQRNYNTYSDRKACANSVNATSDSFYTVFQSPNNFKHIDLLKKVKSEGVNIYQMYAKFHMKMKFQRRARAHVCVCVRVESGRGSTEWLSEI